MKVVIAAIGSRGDVVPFSHLAARFADSGHDVTLVTHDGLNRLAHPSLRVIPVPSDPGVLLAGPAAQAVRRGDPRQLNRTRHLFADFIHSAQQPTRLALAGADVLIASTFAIAAVDEARAQGVPVVRAHLWPEYSGLGGPMPLLPYGWLAPGPVRRLARWSLRRVEPYLGGVHGWWERGRLNLVARHPVGLTTSTVGSLYAFSPHLVPDHPEAGTVTGWWTGPEPAAGLSHEVASALANGEPWIYVGFGSMHQSDPAKLLDRLDAVCAQLGVRAVVQIAGAGPDAAADSASQGTAGARVGTTPAAGSTPTAGTEAARHRRLLRIGEEPHAELFGRVRAVVHHGGAGTTGTAVRAGVPSVVVPHFADQFYWGSRLHALGVAPRPVPRAFASARVLTRAINTALSPAIGHRARDLAERVRGEDGCGLAVRQVEQWLGHPERR